MVSAWRLDFSNGTSLVPVPVPVLAASQRRDPQSTPLRHHSAELRAVSQFKAFGSCSSADCPIDSAMGKKKRSHPDVEEILARPWCYYCRRLPRRAPFLLTVKRLTRRRRARL